MANRERGERSVLVGEVTYTLRPTVNSICDLEDLIGQPFTAIAAKAAEGDLRSMRALVWSYLQDKHGEEIKNVKDAGAWIERAGGLQVIETAMQEVTAANAQGAAQEGTSRPPVAHPVGAPST